MIALLNFARGLLFESELFDLPTFTGGQVHWYEDICPVELSDYSGSVYINKQGEIILPKTGAPYGRADSFYNGIACVNDSQTKLMGFIDIDGNWIVEPHCFSATSFSGESVSVKVPGYARLIDRDGNCIAEYSLEDSETPSDILSREPLLAIRHNADGSIDKYGYWNRDGSIAIDYIFEDARNFSLDGSYAKVQFGGHWGIIDSEGNWLIQPKFLQFAE